MKDIPLPILGNLREICRKCEEFQSAGYLQSMFVISELAVWRFALPEANSLNERIDRTIAYLCEIQAPQGENGLILFLQILAHRYSPEDERQEQLLILVNGLRAHYDREEYKREYYIRQPRENRIAEIALEGDVIEPQLERDDQLQTQLPQPANLDDLIKENQECARLLGRDSLVQQIRERFSSEPVHDFVVLSGPPMIGKTRLLDRIQNLLSRDFVALIVTGQGFDEVQRLNSYVYDLASQLTDSFNIWSARFGDCTILEYPDRASFIEFEGRRGFYIHWRKLMSIANKRKILLMYDEIERFIDRPEQVNPNILSFLEDFIQKSENGCFILSLSNFALNKGHQGFDELIARGHNIRVHHYTDDEVQLVFATLRNYYEDKEDIIHRCMRLCNGHARFLAIVSEAFITRKKQTSEIDKVLLDSDDMDFIIEESVERAEAFLKSLWYHLHEEEKYVVWGVGHLIDGLTDVNRISVQEIFNILYQHDSNFSQDRLMKGIEQLRQREWLRWEDGTKTIFQFKPGIIPIWTYRRFVVPSRAN